MLNIAPYLVTIIIASSHKYIVVVTVALVLK